MPLGCDSINIKRRQVSIFEKVRHRFSPTFTGTTIWGPFEVPPTRKGERETRDCGGEGKMGAAEARAQFYLRCSSGSSEICEFFPERWFGRLAIQVAGSQERAGSSHYFRGNRARIRSDAFLRTENTEMPENLLTGILRITGSFPLRFSSPCGLRERGRPPQRFFPCVAFLPAPMVTYGDGVVINRLLTRLANMLTFWGAINPILQAAIWSLPG
ncbi:hypothetical protein J3R74_000759 [Puniceicoccus vermicola]